MRVWWETLRGVDIGVGVFSLLLGILVLTRALSYDFYQEDGIPGPGFLPTLLAITMAILGAALILSRVRGSADEYGGFDLPDSGRAKRVLGGMAATLVGVALFNIIGFLGSMIVLTGVLIFGVERRRGWSAVLVVVLIPLSFYALFGLLLGVRFPVGPWGI